MDFAEINLLAVLLAAIASFLFGGIWFGMFSRQWLAAINREGASRIEPAWQVDAVPFIVAFVGQLVMAYVLAGIIGHPGADQLSPRNGVVAGAVVWAGFVMTTLVVNHAFQGARHTLTLIDGGHWLGVLVIQGAVIGWFGI